MKANHQPDSQPSRAHRRKPGKREIRRALAARTVGEAVGKITPGVELYGLSKGQFSLIDLITHCLAATGPADVIVSTWTAGGADVDHAFKLLTEGRVRSLMFVVDFSFPSRQPQYCAALRERFGDDAIRITKNHSKFCLIRNEQWNIVLRTSMNLNENRRLESFEVSDDPALADYLAGIVDELFEAETGAEAFTKRPADHLRAFESFAEDSAAPIDEAAMQNSTDVRKYFGDGPLQNDIRRAGLSFQKTGERV